MSEYHSNEQRFWDFTSSTFSNFPFPIAICFLLLLDLELCIECRAAFFEDAGLDERVFLERVLFPSGEEEARLLSVCSIVDVFILYFFEPPWGFGTNLLNFIIVLGVGRNQSKTNCVNKKGKRQPKCHVTNVYGTSNHMFSMPVICNQKDEYIQMRRGQYNKVLEKRPQKCRQRAD